MSRLNTSLEAAGAEFLVLGHLLIEGMQAFKAYTNFPGYDLIATNPEIGKSCRVQVKSRWATDYDGSFPIKNFECDFVILVALNRGYRGYRKLKNIQLYSRRLPEFYIFPVEVVSTAQKPENTWGKVYLKNIPQVQTYISNWGLIASFLNYPVNESAYLPEHSEDT